MNFIEAKNGLLYGAARFISIGPDLTRDSEWVRDVIVDGVGTVEFYGHRIEEFLRQPVATFQAQAGTYVLHLSDESEDGYWKCTVLGWAATRDGRLCPVTVDGVNDGLADPLYVLTPDGRVSQGELDSWSTLEAFLQSQRQGSEGAAV